jgi:hypothetical protein
MASGFGSHDVYLPAHLQTRRRHEVGGHTRLLDIIVGVVPMESSYRVSVIISAEGGRVDSHAARSSRNRPNGELTQPSYETPQARRASVPSIPNDGQRPTIRLMEVLVNIA